MVAGANAESIPLGAYVPRLGGTTALAAALPFYNVKDYGAKGDGVTDDSAAINAAITALLVVGIGILFFPPGTYIANNLVTPNQSTGYIIFQGAGMYATTLLSNAGGTAQTLAQKMPGEVCDMTIDGGGVATNSLAQITAGTVAITQMAARRVRMRNCLNGGGGWVHIVWDQGSLYQIDRYYLEECVWEGPASTSSDAAAVTYVNMCFVKNHRIRAVPRTPNFYQINYLVVDGIYISGTTGSSGGLVVDGGVANAKIRGLVSPDNTAGTEPHFNTPNLSVEHAFFGYGPQLNIGALANARYRFLDTEFNLYGPQVQQAVAELSIKGGKIVSGASVGCIVDNAPASTTHNGIEIIGTTLDLTTNTNIWHATSSTLNGSGFNHCPIVGGPPVVTGVTQGSGFGVRWCAGYNPVGVVSPAVPASGSPVAAVLYDRTFYVSTVAGTTTCSLAIQNGPTVTFVGAVAQVIAVRVPAGKTVTPTYTGTAPTWVVEGE